MAGYLCRQGILHCVGVVLGSRGIRGYDHPGDLLRRDIIFLLQGQHGVDGRVAWRQQA